MTLFFRRAILLAVLMFSAAFATFMLTPKIVPRAALPDLEALIPRQFADWHMDERESPMIINPQQQESLNKIYSQVLSRTYFDAEGRRVMLSLAYGADQSHDNQIHKPEVCYPAQGFRIINKYKEIVNAGKAALPVMRIYTQLGQRHEPVTYWIRVGDDLVRGVLEQNLSRIRTGLKGDIPDGILFRVSEINSDVQSSYALQDRFIDSFLMALTPEARNLLIGSM